MQPQHLLTSPAPSPFKVVASAEFQLQLEISRHSFLTIVTYNQCASIHRQEGFSFDLVEELFQIGRLQRQAVISPTLLTDGFAHHSPRLVDAGPCLPVLVPSPITLDPVARLLLALQYRGPLRVDDQCINLHVCLCAASFHDSLSLVANSAFCRLCHCTISHHRT